jgi:osmotically inducible lipoprotein OsmB
MRRITLAAVFLLSLFALGGCGNRPGERAVSGAGIGAGVGAVGGLMFGDPLEGAVIGGAVGAGVGGLTSPGQINLGRPIWR